MMLSMISLTPIYRLIGFVMFHDELRIESLVQIGRQAGASDQELMGSLFPLAIQQKRSRSSMEWDMCYELGKKERYT